MKKLIAVLVPVLMVAAGAYGTGGETHSPDHSTSATASSQLNSQQIQNMQGQGYASADGGDGGAGGAGGDASSSSGATGGEASSSSGAISTLSTSSTSNFRTRTPPISTSPPYLPYWRHGGWGTVKAYFPNGPNKDDQVYERAFDPENAQDKKQLRGVLESLPHDGPIELLGGILNGVGALFCGPDNYHHGRGFEIANSLIRERRRKGSPLLIFIDSNVDTNLLRRAGYAYVGKVSLEGNVDRNWDQAYDAAVAETLPWDVDILLISGGMKGVTVGSSQSFPGAGGAYSQANYSVSLFGSTSSGITEGKGKAAVSAEAYRFSPAIINRTAIPQSFYDRIRASASARPTPTHGSVEPTQRISVPATRREVGRAQATPGARAPLGSSKRAVHSPGTSHEAPTAATTRKNAGVDVSRTLWEMAAFDKNQMVDYVIIR